MPSRYIPRADRAALAWFRTFADGLTGNYARYGATPADAAAIQQAVDRFAQAMEVNDDPARRTIVTVRDKNESRISAEQICSVFAMAIKQSAGITADDKIAIGVRPINRQRQKVQCPTTEPILNIVGASTRTHKLRFRDITTPESSRKPFGAVALQLFAAIGDSVETDPAKASWVGQATKNPIGVAFKAEDDQKRVTYFARWISRRGEVGPWSAPVSMSVAA